MAPAVWAAWAASSSPDTTDDTNPKVRASAASRIRPVRHRSRATDPPTRSCRGPYTTSPKASSGWANRAVVDATRTSHMTARSKPPARAGPLTAATVGKGNSSHPR